MLTAGRAIAGFDSASGMVRVLGAALDGHDAALLAQLPRSLESPVDWLAGRIERMPEPVPQAIYRKAGWLDALPAQRLEEVRSEQLAEWVVRKYPQRQYPLVFVGSSNGALVHLAAALGVPWLPQTLLLAVRHGGLDPDDPVTDMREMADAGRSVLASNSGIELHHMHDPSQDRLMIARMTYFRVKFLALPAPYRRFLTQCLAPGGNLVLVDCGLRWPVTTVGDRHVFQFGAPGGISAAEFHEGGARVEEFLRRQGANRNAWTPPAPDKHSPEAEWGFAEPLAADVSAFGRSRNLILSRLRFDEPENMSPLIAELFRTWYATDGLPLSQLLVSSFLLMDPVQAMRTGSVPYWALFGSRPSLDRLAGYLETTAMYDEIRLGIFPHGTESAGLPTVTDWQAVLKYARHGGRLLAVDSDYYPRHFRALTGFHRELARLPQQTIPQRLEWRFARDYLATEGASHNVRLE